MTNRRFIENMKENSNFYIKKYINHYVYYDEIEGDHFSIDCASNEDFDDLEDEFWKKISLIEMDEGYHTDYNSLGQDYFSML